MTPESVGPLSRPVLVARIPPSGLEVEVCATSDECAALARDFGLPEIKSFLGSFTLTGTGMRVRVKGRVRADIVQICVVTLEPFESVVDEHVEVEFEEPPPERLRADPRPEIEPSEEGPDEIVDGRIDVGALAAEFLALGLDPYPRKPGVSFAYEEQDETPHPFSALGALKPKDS